jgi:hypothetical protein
LRLALLLLFSVPAANPIVAGDTPAPPVAPVVVAVKADLKIPATLAAEPGVAVLIEATTDGKTIRWIPISPGCQVFSHFDPEEPGKRFGMFLAPRPGTYKVLAYTAVGDVPSKPAYCVITVHDPNPPPVPPTPVPPVPPTPVPPVPVPVTKANAWIVVVFESSQQTAEYAATMANSDMWQAFTARGHKWRLLDKDLPIVRENGYQRILDEDKVSMPAVILVDQTTKKKLCPAQPLPKNPAEFTALVEKFAGK